MTNINAVNKTNDKQSLLPQFTQPTDNKGESFRDILNSARQSNDIISSPYAQNNNYFQQNRENNSYYNRPYAEKNSYTSYSERNQDNRYNKDRQPYEGVENKFYNSNENVSYSKNKKDGNNIKDRLVFGRRDVRTLGRNQMFSQPDAGRLNDILNGRPSASAFNSFIQHSPHGSGNIVSGGTGGGISNGNTAPSIPNGGTVEEQDLLQEVSIDDILNLLQLAAGLSKEPSNEELAGEMNPDAQAENIISTIVAKLQISNNLKGDLKDVLMAVKELPENDVKDILATIQSAVKNMEGSNQDKVDDLSLLKLSNLIMSSVGDEEALNQAYDDLQDKLEQFKNDIFKSDLATNKEVVSDLNTQINALKEFLNKKSEGQETTKPDNTVNPEGEENSVRPEIKDANTQVTNILESIVNLLAKANQSGKPIDKEQLVTAKELLSSIKNVLEEGNINKNLVAKLTDISNSLKGGDLSLIKESDIKSLLNNQEETVSLDESLLQESAKVKDTTSANSTVSKENPLKNNVLEKVSVIENTASNKTEQVEEPLKDTAKLSEQTTKESVKQSDTLTTKDIQKEFKTVNVASETSLRNESQAKIDLKANTVNLTDVNKGLTNNLKEQVTVTQNNQGENFSATQSDKGNNFNYFLKSSAEAQAKYETAQPKEANAPYNMKEPRDIERLVRTMHSSAQKGESKLTVVLTPENLGKLQIHLSETGGKLTAKFVAENESSHKLIMAQSDLLKNQLSEKGIVIDNMEFAFNDTMSKGQNGEENGRKANRQSQKGKNFKSQEDDLEVGTEVANKKASGIYA